MKKFIILTESIDFIERNLCEPITRKDISNHCYVALSTLEKLFRYALGMQALRDKITIDSLKTHLILGRLLMRCCKIHRHGILPG